MAGTAIWIIIAVPQKRRQSSNATNGKIIIGVGLRGSTRGTTILLMNEITLEMVIADTNVTPL
eukprot:4164718-Karenia_brevis.AAC.1